jgi:two-component system sensor histidine kinase and response regulator WspE
MAAKSGQDFTDLAMLDLFRAEVDAHSQTLNEGLLALEKAPDSAGPIEALMRAAHSIKGAARIVGIDPCARLAHAMEDCLVAAQEGRLTLGAAAIDVLLRCADAVVQIARPGDWAAANAAALDRLLDELAAVRAGKPPAAPPPSAAPPAAVAPADLTREAAEQARKEIAARIDTSQPVSLDLGAVREVDPFGLALLAALARAAGRASLSVTGASPEVAELLRWTGLPAPPPGDR